MEMFRVKRRFFFWEMWFRRDFVDVMIGGANKRRGEVFVVVDEKRVTRDV